MDRHRDSTRVLGPRRGVGVRPTWRFRLALAVTAAAWLLPTDAPAAVIPVFNGGSGSGGHLPGSPGGANYGAGLTMVNGTPGLDVNFDPSTITFPGGSTKAKAGLGRTQSLSNAKILFAAGTGVSQTDPGHVQSASTLEYTFGATWTIPLNQTFGPPIVGSFSVPIGGVVGAGGSASFQVEVHWDAYNAGLGSSISDARAPYLASQTFTSAGTFATTFTAPASPFTPSSLFSPTNGEGTSQISMHGFMRFMANNDTTTTFIEIPSLEDLPDLANQPSLFSEAYMAFSEVPEPTATGTFALAATGLLAARRRRQGLKH